MPAPRVLILRAPGTNCDMETAYAFELAGAVTERIHINQLLETPALTKRFQVLCLPGGFSYGDDVAAGRILANQFRHHLSATLQEFKQAGHLILGVCNGFQILIKSGVLLADEPTGPPATLTWSESGRYLDRWVDVVVDGSKCVFLQGIQSMYLPIAHAEGKFVTRDRETLSRLCSAGQLALRYGTEPTKSVDDCWPFPVNPNGAWANVAGVCDETGRVFGLMPHPERHLDPTNHPQWTRLPPREHGDGLQLFQNAVRYFA
ncbi:MAG: phosphoribosylformylglycinamidine synthase subunit PurQ [Planctomycetota bacterium]